MFAAIGRLPIIVFIYFFLADEPVAAKLLTYNRANRAVAILCNHQRAVPKNFDKQMENLQAKVNEGEFCCIVALAGVDS